MIRCASIFLTVLCASTALGAEVKPSAKGKSIAKGQPTDLAEVIIEADLDKPFPEDLRHGVGGGLHVEMLFNAFYHPDLRQCHARVRQLGLDWGKRNKLTVANDETGIRRSLLHLNSAAPDGFFELVYRIHPEHKAVHAYLLFFDASLKRLSPNAIAPMVKRFGLSDFVKELKAAATCTDGKGIE